jgi:hypothetical protein
MLQEHHYHHSFDTKSGGGCETNILALFATSASSTASSTRSEPVGSAVESEKKVETSLLISGTIIAGVS